MIRLVLSPKDAAALRTAARTIAVISTAIFSYLAISQGPPVPPEGPGIERDIQYVFLVIGTLATILSWWSPATGGLLMLLAGLVLGVAAAMRYSEETALAVALLYVIPGSLFIATWASRRPAFIQIAALALIVALMAYGGMEARSRHEYAFGPAHPESAKTETPYKDVEWVWSGGATQTGAVVKARTTQHGASTRLATFAGPDFEAPAFTTPLAVDNDGVLTFSLTGLTPNTEYRYAVEVDGVLDVYRRGSFRTFPTGPASFTVAVGACARTGSNGAVFDAINATEPLLYIVAGDIHYENVTTNDFGGFRHAYQRVLTSPAQSDLYRSTPIAYVWDDHDFGGNNSDASSPAREAALRAYQTYVPHYDLSSASEEAPIYQAFSAGRVRFIMLDTRSVRNDEKRADGSRSLLGKEQLAWLKHELVTASHSYELVVLVSAVPWVGDRPDSWGDFASERREIANFIADHDIDNLLMVAGDAHMVAIDDGTNTDYSDDRSGGFPLLHAGALDRPGSVKGGPYSEGAYPGAGQFGLLEVQDDGESLNVRISGHVWDGTELVSLDFRVGSAAAKAE
jgi:phosphodiesterase/alkaline phosphatase D-like protein